MTMSKEKLAELEAIAIRGESQEDRLGKVSVKVAPSDLLSLSAAARGLERGRWIPVTERLPEPDTVVLAFWRHPIFGASTEVLVAERGDSGTWYAPPHDPEVIQDVVAWMPLPSAPEQTKEEANG